MKRRQVANAEAAIRAYYGNGYIGTAEVKAIFGDMSDATACNYKRYVKDEERAREIPEVVPHHVSTKIAFEVWKIDIKELERNRQKLRSLGLEEEPVRSEEKC